MENYRSVQLKMLQDMDRVCREHQIPYILSGYTARAAALDHALPAHISVPTVAMYYTDAVKLPALLPQYQWESTLQNRMVPHTRLRCSNPDTFYMRADEVGYYRNQGLCVDIELIRPVPGKGMINRALVAMEAACVMCAHFRHMPGIRGKIFALTAPAEKIALRLAYTGKFGSSKRIRISRFPKKSVEFAKSFLTDRAEIDVCGHAFYAPRELEKFMLVEFHDKWRHVSAQKDGEDFHLAVMDAHAPSPEMAQLVADAYGDGPPINWMKWYRMRGRSRKLRQKIRSYWEILFCTKDRFDFYRQLKPQKEKILALRAAGDDEALRNLLQPYLESIHRHARQGLTPCFDREIWENALYLLEKEGKAAYAQKIRQSVRPEHLEPLKLEGFDHE